MKKLLIALVAGFMSLSIAGAYDADNKKGDKKADSMSKSDKKDTMAKDSTAKDDDKKKSKDKKDPKYVGSYAGLKGPASAFFYACTSTRTD